MPSAVVSTYLTTFTVFRAVFQVLGLLQGEWAPIKTTPELKPFLIRLWPPTGKSVAWPRGGLAFDNRGLEDFAQRRDFL